ncbi:tetratricopeptide repeat protein [Cytophagales bacterium LB-30]|uniref:Tetratricopeptide repeat protein n=1 Tax=Shiella aurantiaca TaxID=3058365 RepID=A0ABT8F5D0_9BACT|nr:tetratricopeptide repeat protein [Shiella aurantiaca]MDN4165673.1 tetratricopeptide repeat protein [Shiella aurantiaca]
MLKNRIILAVVAVLMVVVLYTLPKVVVKNEEEAVEQHEEEEASSETEPAAEEMHKQEMPATLKPIVKELNQAWLATGGNKLQTADSLRSLYLAAGVMDSAIYFSEQLVALQPDAATWRKAGEVYYEAFGFTLNEQKQAAYGEKARGFFQKVLDAEPNAWDVKTKMAMTYVSSKTPMQGILMLREVLENDPENTEALFNLGVLSIQTGQYDKAVERFERLLEVEPQHVQGNFYLGVAFMELGKKEQARAQFERVKQLDLDPAVQATVESYLQNL